MVDDIIEPWLSRYISTTPLFAAAAVTRWPAATAPEHTVVWPASSAAASPLLAANREAAKRDTPLSARIQLGTPAVERRAVAVALRKQGAPVGAIALLLNEGVEAEDAELFRFARAAAESLGALLAPASSSAADLLRLQTFLTNTDSLALCGASLVSELASALALDRVSLGLLEREDLCLLAVSNSADSSPGATTTSCISAAMQEAIDQDQAIAFPQPNGAPPRIVQAHGALASQGAGRVLTVPLVHRGQRIGALCFEGSTASRATTWRLATELACGLAALIDLKRRAELSWNARARNGVRAAIAKMGRYPRKCVALAVGIAGGAAAILTLLPFEHRIGAPARLEGAVQRSVAAPVDGYVQSVHVRPGDFVKLGELLVEMAPQDLLLEERKWDAEATQHDNTATASLAVADRAQFAVARAKADEARAQLDLVRDHLQRSRLTSPIDGVVIGGDLAQSIGAPVQRGQVLMTLAPRDAYRLIVEVDERDVAELLVGQRGQLALAAMPSKRFDFRVTRITPVAITADGRNAFEVEGQLDDTPTMLRPGLRGVAKIVAGERSLLGIAIQPGVDWLRLAFWRWGF